MLIVAPAVEVGALYDCPITFEPRTDHCITRETSEPICIGWVRGQEYGVVSETCWDKHSLGLCDGVFNRCETSWSRVNKVGFDPMVPHASWVSSGPDAFSRYIMCASQSSTEVTISIVGWPLSKLVPSDPGILMALVARGISIPL